MEREFCRLYVDYDLAVRPSLFHFSFPCCYSAFHEFSLIVQQRMMLNKLEKKGLPKDYLFLFFYILDDLYSTQGQISGITYL